MTVHLVTFSDESMRQSAEMCVVSGLRYGCDDYDHLSYSSLKQHDFYREHEALLSQARGCGFWAWKPYLIKHALDYGEPGSYVIYADAGIEFISDINEIISCMDQDLWLFGNNWEHAHWCKRDAVQEIWPSKWWKPNLEYNSDKAVTWERFGKQVQASVIFFRVTDYSRAFVKEWLDWCLFEGGRLIDDSPSRTPNHPEFCEHRHDQAILTTMAYREGLKLHWWPASYNDGAFVYDKLPVYAKDDYPVLFNHHRRRNHEWAKCA